MTGYTARSRRGTAEAVRSALHDFFRRVDPVLLVCTLVLTGLGLLTIWGAVDNFGQRKLKMQFAMAVLGIIMTFVVANLDYHIILERLWLPFLIFSVGILALTLVAGSTGEGIETSNKSWLTVPVVGIAIQPSEFVKITFICTYSRHLALVQSRIRSPRVLPWLAVHALLIVGLILLSGDLGVALVYIAMILLLLFCAGLPLWWFGGGALVGAVALPFLWNRLQPYQQERILVGFNPELDPLDKGWQALMSRQCIENGGLLGVGLRTGGNYEDLAASHTDFIFATVCEKFGFVGGLLVIAVLAVMVWRILWIGKPRCRLLHLHGGCGGADRAVGREPRYVSGSAACCGTDSALCILRRFLCAGVLHSARHGAFRRGAQADKAGGGVSDSPETHCPEHRKRERRMPLPLPALFGQFVNRGCLHIIDCGFHGQPIVFAR